jgi:DNA invertase Pin-like site-specific DNA recombinase
MYLIAVTIKVTNCNVSYLLISAQLAIKDVLQKAEKISESMDEVHVKADVVSSSVKNKLRPRLEQLSSDFQVNAVINHSKSVTTLYVENLPFS